MHLNTVGSIAGAQGFALLQQYICLYRDAPDPKSSGGSIDEVSLLPAYIAYINDTHVPLSTKKPLYSIKRSRYEFI